MLRRILLAVVLSFAPWRVSERIEAAFFYHPRSNGVPTPSEFESVRFPTSGGLTLHGWFMPAREHASGGGPAPTVLHVHGNTGDVANHRGACEFLSRLGFNVLLFDYRGFGRSDVPDGPLTREGLAEDTLAALDYLASRPDIDISRIAVYGYSLGATFALYAAAERPWVCAAVAFAGFAGWEEIASDHAGLVGPILINRGYDAAHSIGGLGERPVLIVHGTADGIVPVRHAHLLADAAARSGVPVELLILDGVGHLTLPREPGVASRVGAFLHEAMPAVPATPWRATPRP